MADIIHQLPDVIANQIAAGEVVQRPASVVKEMMENSVDAGSRNIDLYLEDAGKKLIQITDDGCGMSETDVRMALERHATSKIRELEDLFKIRTLGFRGEALASIAAVSQLTVKTKRKEDDTGTVLVCEGGEVVKQEPVSCPDGTTIAVKNLFYNVPARRNFLKSNSAEMKHIMDTFVSVSMANPGISFRLYDNGKKTYHLPIQNLRKRIVSLFGRKYDKALVPVDEGASFLSVKGFAGSRELARKRRGEQYFFINQRYIRDPYLNHAVISAFNELLPVGHFPFYVLFLEMNPERVDINVHPTKTEVKFEDAGSVYAILRSAVQKALNKYHVAPSIDFEKDEKWDNYTRSNSKSQINVNREELPDNARTRIAKKGGEQTREDWEDFYKILSLQSSQENSKDDGPEQSRIETGEAESRRNVMQVHDHYIVTVIRSGIIMIHRYLAMERILYEQYLSCLENEKNVSQQQLFPEVIEVDPADSKLFQQIIPSLEPLGFTFEAFGKNAWLLKGVPAEIQAESAKEMTDEMLEAFKHHQNKQNLNNREKIAKSLAGTASRRQKTGLKQEEMSVLIDRLFACKEPYYSPGGKPTFITLSLSELDKKFNQN